MRQGTLLASGGAKQQPAAKQQPGTGRRVGGFSLVCCFAAALALHGLATIRLHRLNDTTALASAAAVKAPRSRLREPRKAAVRRAQPPVVAAVALARPAVKRAPPTPAAAAAPARRLPAAVAKKQWTPPPHPDVTDIPLRPQLPVLSVADAVLRRTAINGAGFDAIDGGGEANTTRENRLAAGAIIGRANASNGGWPEETIFVSIASYRDPECAKTIARAYAKAAHPDRVFFGVYQQNDAKKDVDCVLDLAKLIKCPGHAACGRATRDQIRAYKVDWMATLGPTVARHLSETLFRDETYVVSFDSHTNFANGWDAIAIDMFKRVGNPRAIFTTYPASYRAGPHSEKWADVGDGPCEACRSHDDESDKAVSVLPEMQNAICRTRRVAVGRTMSFKHDVNTMRRPFQSTRVPFLAAGFNFASGSRVREVPYDKHSAFLFDGEETSLAVRAWTHGYDFYHPDRDLVSHLYIPNKSPLRPVFWTTDWAKRSRVQFWTMLRVNYVMGLHNLLDFWVNATYIDKRDLQLYGLGRRRPVADYWKYAAISPKRDAPEWSPLRCALFETTGLDEAPFEEHGIFNDYSDYDASFRLDS